MSLDTRADSPSLTPQVSVVIPTYGRSEYLPATLESVFRQTFTDHEVIVVVDGPPGDTAQILDPLVEAGRIRYVTQHHGGPAAARNRGIAVASGPLIALLDDDDLWPPDKLEWQVHAMQAHPTAVLVYGYMEPLGQEAWYRFPGRQAPAGRVGAAFLERNWIRSLGQTLIRTQALRAVGGLDTRLWGVDDWDLYVRLADRGEFLYAPRAALYHRVHAGNASRDFFRMYVNARRVQRRYLGRWPRPGNARLWLACRRSIRTFCMNEFLAVVRPHMRAGRWSRVAALTVKALRIDPATVATKTLQTLRTPGARSPSVDAALVDPPRARPPAATTASEGSEARGPDTLRIRVEGPFDDSFSLAIVNRNLALALARQPGVTVTLAATQEPRDAYLVDKPRLAGLWRPSQASAPVDCVIRNTYPPLGEGLDPRARSFAYFAWEDSLVPPEWSDAFNRHFDGVMAPSEFVRGVLRRSGVAVPIGIVPYVVELEGLARTPPLDLGTRKSFRFLHVSTGIPRKGCDVLLRAYAAEFSAGDDVCLVIKTLPQYHNDVERRVRHVRRWRRRCPEIVHLDADLPDEAMRRLYRAASCLVHPARAEGFGLPVAEAMLARVPVIVTGYGGAMEFCSSDTAWLVAHRIVPSRSEHRIAGAEWAEPDLRDLRAQMRAVYEARVTPALRQKVERAFATVSSQLTGARVAERALAFIDTVDRRAHRGLRVGMVTPWNSACGVAEYSRFLVAATSDAAIRWTILAPRDEPRLGPDGDHVHRCWARGGADAVADIVTVAEREALEAVHVQFTFADLDLEGLQALIGRLKRNGHQVLVTCHAIEASVGPGRSVTLGDIAAPLQAVDRIFVHTERDRRRLSTWGVADNVTHLPHGFPRAETARRDTVRHRLGLEGDPVLGTFGFLRPHKGTLQVIEALALLRRCYPRVGLLAATSLYPDSASRRYLDECRSRVVALGLERHCRIVSDFLPAQEIVGTLQAADVVVMPYAEIADSVSGAVRLALACGRPVVTTRRRVFEDVSEETLQIDAATPAAIERGVRRLLEDRALSRTLVDRGRVRASRDGWAEIGRMYAKILRALDD